LVELLVSSPAILQGFRFNGFLTKSHTLGNKTEIARFIEFLTGKSYDSIYKKVREPLKLKDSEAKKDLEFVKAYFVKLGLSEIVKMINNEIAQSS